MKQAVLVGGPHDGKCVDVPDSLPHLYRIINPKRTNVYDMEKPSAFTPRFDVIVYKNESVFWPVDTKLVFYTFYGVE